MNIKYYSIMTQITANITLIIVSPIFILGSYVYMC